MNQLNDLKMILAARLKTDELEAIACICLATIHDNSWRNLGDESGFSNDPSGYGAFLASQFRSLKRKQ